MDNIKHNSLEELWLDYGDRKMDSEINTNLQSAQNLVQRIDPLAMNLDGNSIDKASVNKDIVFDFNSDGIKKRYGLVRRRR